MLRKICYNIDNKGGAYPIRAERTINETYKAAISRNQRICGRHRKARSAHAERLLPYMQQRQDEHRGKYVP